MCRRVVVPFGAEDVSGGGGLPRFLPLTAGAVAGFEPAFLVCRRCDDIPFAVAMFMHRLRRLAAPREGEDEENGDKQP